MEDADRLCDACGLAKGIYGNTRLLGKDALLCWDCAMNWYDNGINSAEELKKLKQEKLAEQQKGL